MFAGSLVLAPAQASGTIESHLGMWGEIGRRGRGRVKRMASVSIYI